MSPLQLGGFVFTGVVATAVVLTREPRRQVLVLAVYGLVLTILFMLLQAPDVAFSELAVGAAAVPLMLLITLAGTSRKRTENEERER